MINVFALIDAGNTPDFFEMLEQHNPPVSCLYNDPVQEELKLNAPYLIEVTEPIKTWLATKTEMPWGLYLLTEPNITFIELRTHLRCFTYVMIPLSEKPVFFRFYDPRVFWNLTNILEDHQLHDFLGPISIVASYYKGVLKQDHFMERRLQSSPLKIKSPYLTLDDAQFKAFDQIYEDQYIEKLSDYMLQKIDPKLFEEIEHHVDQRSIELQQMGDENTYFQFSNQTGLWTKTDGHHSEAVSAVVGLVLNQIAKNPISEAEFHHITHHQYDDLAFYEEPLRGRGKPSLPSSIEELKAWVRELAHDFYHFCQKQKITDNQSHHLLAGLMMKRNIFTFKDIPSLWIKSLLLDDNRGEYRARMLLYQISEGEG